MRIIQLLLIGIGFLSLTAAVSTTTVSKTKSKSSNTKVGNEKPTKINAAVAAATSTPSTATSSSRSSKSLKSGVKSAEKTEDNRGKRTLYDFGNGGFLYPQIAGRRTGSYQASGRAYSPTIQGGNFYGKNLIAALPQYPAYPQYLEAPEPIIEIIIKDANDTIPPQPVITKSKKKKEKIQVYYVNYKKDANNKLHLETPIASLNNDNSNGEEEEEEEVEEVHYPTPQPRIKATTLRTVIHPDSEKYHSNSGIHVTFGSEHKSHEGDIIEEHDAESVQRQVVALPIGPTAPYKTSPNYNGGPVLNYQNFGQTRGNNGNSYFFNSALSSPIVYPAQQQGQQLPHQYGSQYFRTPPTTGSGPATAGAVKSQSFPQSHYYQPPNQNAAQQQRPAYNFGTKPFNNLQQQQLQSQPQPQPQAQQHAAQYYVNFNQQYPQPPRQSHPQQQQQHQQQQQQQQFSINYQQKQTNPGKVLVQGQPIHFPTAPGKTQELPSHQTPAPYQPIKFRPTAGALINHTPIQQKPANIKPFQYHKPTQPFPQQIPSFALTSTQTNNYYKPQQQQQQQHHQAHLRPQPQHTQQSIYQQQQQHQPQPQPQPQTSVQTHQQQYFPQKTQQKAQQNYHQQQKYQSYSGWGAGNSAGGAGDGGNHYNPLNLLTGTNAKQTELLQSIPKFETHITETIQQHHNYQNQNQVIHDIPAPNLTPQNKQQQAQQQQLQQHQSAYNNQQYQLQAQQSKQKQQFSNFVTNAYVSTTQSPQFGQSTDGQKIMIVTPQPPTAYNQYQTHQQYQSKANNQPRNSVQVGGTQVRQQEHQQQHQQQQQQTIQGDHYQQYYNQQPLQSTKQGEELQGPTSVEIQASLQSAENINSGKYSVSNYAGDVFKELEQRRYPTPIQSQLQQQQQQQQQHTIYKSTTQESTTPTTTSTNATPSSSTVNPKTLLQLPDEVPEDLRQQLLTSGILNHADISVLDYDKIGDTALENLPPEHLQHFYGAGGGGQISESKKILTVVRPNGDKVQINEKDLERVKQSNSVPLRSTNDVKLVGYESPSDVIISQERQYNRYLPLKINGAQFPKPEMDDLKNKIIKSVVVLAPVESNHHPSVAATSEDTKEVKFLGGDLIRTVIKKPTKDNFRRWLEKEAHNDVERQSVVLLVVKSTLDSTEQEIYMYDIITGAVNKLNGELSSTFVSVAEENVSGEDLEYANTLDPSILENVMQKIKR